MSKSTTPSLRQRQAQETKATILRAARTLFARRGYQETSVADIAEEAGVAVPTVYKAVGSKEVILRAIIDLIGVDDGDTDRIRALEDADTADAILHNAIVLMTELQARFGDVIRAIQSAAKSAPEAAAALAHGEAMHRDGTARMIARIHALGALREGLTLEDAARVTNLLTSASSYGELVEAYGMSHADAGFWLERQLRAWLLASTP